MVYEKIILIGVGQIATDCLKVLCDVCNSTPEVIVYEYQALSTLISFAKKFKCKIIELQEREKTTQYFMGIDTRTLIVSANNNYIFPEKVVSKENLTILNFHNSLLPYHRGRNAPVWAIFEQDKETGISWHYIDREIDNGDLVAQEVITLSMEITALELIRICMKKGIENFCKILPEVLSGKVNVSMQKELDSYVIHHSKDLPNGGIIDLDWDIEKIGAFLRSLDFGKLYFADCFVIIKGEQRKVNSYQIENIPYSDSKKIVIDEMGISIIQRNKKVVIKY